MKIIDLLNKIANGEEVPKKIKFGYDIYELGKNNRDYYNIENKVCLSLEYNIIANLNDTVEILEEEPRDIEVCGSWFTKSEYDKLFLEEEKKIPEKLDLYDEGINILKQNEYVNARNSIHKSIISLECEYNQLLDYLKSKGE